LFLGNGGFKEHAQFLRLEIVYVNCKREIKMLDDYML
jgi:hypothetical protein